MEQIKPLKFPLVKLPADTQVTLYLIKQELKIRRFFNTLAEVGLDSCDYEPHLDDLILQRMGMDGHTDETFDAYYEIMERRSRKIGTDEGSVVKQAMKAYVELMGARKKLPAFAR